MLRSGGGGGGGGDITWFIVMNLGGSYTLRPRIMFSSLISFTYNISHTSHVTRHTSHVTRHSMKNLDVEQTQGVQLKRHVLEQFIDEAVPADKC